MNTFYGVKVYDHDGAIVTIEPQVLAGRDIGAREDAAIRSAIQQLSGFIGLSPATREAGCADADLTCADGGNMINLHIQHFLDRWCRGWQQQPIIEQELRQMIQWAIKKREEDVARVDRSSRAAGPGATTATTNEVVR